MRLVIVIFHNIPETVFNAFRLANFALTAGDKVSVFLLGKGVEIDQIMDEKFDVHEQARTFLNNGGEIQACGTCLKIRDSAGSELCPLSTMQNLYEMIKESDKVITF